MGAIKLFKRLVRRTLHLAALVCNPLVLKNVPAIRQRVPKPAARVLGIMSWPLVGFHSLGVISPDVQRSIRVWSHILPIFTGYIWTKWSCDIGMRVFGMSRKSVEARWAVRHDQGGQQVFDMVTQVRGYYVKTGQILATKREFVPACWCSRLSKLWDDTKPRPWKSVRKSIIKDLKHTTAAAWFISSTHQQSVPSTAQGAHSVNTPRSSKGPDQLSKLPSPKKSPTTCSMSDSINTVLWLPNTARRLFVQPLGFETSSNWGLRATPDNSTKNTDRGDGLQQLQGHSLPWDGNLLPCPALEQKLPLKKRLQWKDAAKVFDRVFERIDPVPLASASIAQVHTARLSQEALQYLGDTWEHGPEVVIKVQHADVQKLMGADLRNIGRIARFLNHVLPFDVTPAVKEMQRVIPKEFDFEREARLMAVLRQRLATRTGSMVVVPEPVMPLCGPGIIVMQKMEGTPLTSLLAAADKGDIAAREACKRCLAPVLDAYGHMMLVDGLFHADPHPGNMLLQPDGRVALLDYGQCKALTVSERRALCGLYAGLARNDMRLALHSIKHFGLVFGKEQNPAPSTNACPQNTSQPVRSDSCKDELDSCSVCSSSNSTNASPSKASTSSSSPNKADSIVSSKGLQSLGTGSWISGLLLNSSHGWLQRSSSGWLGKLLASSVLAGVKDPELAADLQKLQGVDLGAVKKMLTIMFDTRWVSEGAYAFGGGDVVEGAPLNAIPGALYLVCRAILILRGICAALRLDDVSVVAAWAKHAAAGLKEDHAIAEARARENQCLDLGRQSLQP